MNHTTALPGTVPWGTPLGTTGNTRAASIPTTATGRPVWSAPLPERAANSIVVAADGMIFVAGEQHLSAFAPIGRPAWAFTSPLLSSPTLHPDGALLIYDGTGISVREQATGQQRAHIATGMIATPTVTPSGDLVFGDYQEDTRAFVLICATVHGKQRWTQPLTGPITGPPIICADHIVVSDGRFLRVYTLDGHPAWLLDAAATGSLGGDQDVTVGADQPATFRFPLMHVGAAVVLAQVEQPAGNYYLLIDVQGHTIHPIEAHLPAGVPLAFAAMPNVPQIITLDWPQQDSQEAWHSAVIAVTLAGQQVWSHRVTGKTLAVATDADGLSLIVCSPSLDYWDKYHDWYHLEEECFVRCLTPSGTKQWTWQAPGPLSPVLAIGAVGEIYTVADGQLWAIGS